MAYRRSRSVRSTRRYLAYKRSARTLRQSRRRWQQLQRQTRSRALRNRVNFRVDPSLRFLLHSIPGEANTRWRQRAKKVWGRDIPASYPNLPGIKKAAPAAIAGYRGFMWVVDMPPNQFKRHIGKVRNLYRKLKANPRAAQILARRYARIPYRTPGFKKKAAPVLKKAP